MYKVEDNRLTTYRQICAAVKAEPSDDEKTLILKKFFENGTDQNGFTGDLVIWVKMLLPNNGALQHDNKRLRKQLIKNFSRLFGCDDTEMLRHFEIDLDLSETLRKFFEESIKFPPQSKSTLYLQDVEDFSKKLMAITREDEQFELLKNFCSKLTALDLKTVIRIVLKEENSNLTTRHVLDAIAIMAYPTFVSKRDLEAVVREFGGKIMQSVRDRLIRGKRYTRFWEICSFFLIFVFVYTLLQYLRSIYVELAQ